MVMDRHDIALVIAGVIGSGGAVAHGVLTQWHIIDPIQELAVPRISTTVQRLVSVLLQFSTFNWLVGGSPCSSRPSSLDVMRGLQRVCWWGARISTRLSATSGQPTAAHTWLLYGTALCL